MLPDVPLGSTRITGETETYYILHGTGTYSDNGEKTPGTAGGYYLLRRWKHSWIGKHWGREDLVFMALIING